MSISTITAGLIIVGALAWLVRQKLLVRTTVYAYQHGLRFDRGQFTGVVEPGSYWLLRYTSSIVTLEARPRVILIPGQEVLTADAVSIKLSVALKIEVTDPRLAFMQAEDFEEALYAQAQLVLRKHIGRISIDDLLASRETIADGMTADVLPFAEALGVVVHSIAIKDVMLPGSLKESFSQVARARQEALANLERIRGETAALRKLRNTSSLLKNDPNLYKLRMLQVVAGAERLTVNLDAPEIERNDAKSSTAESDSKETN